MILKTSGFKSWKKIAAFIVIGIVMVLLAISAGSYFYLQSNHFREILHKSLVELSGDRIDLTDQIKIESLFPKVQVSFPNAKARLQNFSFGYERIRVHGLKLTLSPSVLFSRAKRGEIVISIDSLAAIASNKPDSHNTAETDLTIAEQLKEFLNRLSQMSVVLEISDLNYINRDQNSVSTYVKVHNIVLEAEQTRLNLMMGKLVSNQNSYTLDFSLSNITWSKEPIGTLSGKLAIAGNTEENDDPHSISSELKIAGNTLSFNQAEYKNSYVWLRGHTDIFPDTKPRKIRGEIELRKVELAQFLSEQVLNSDSKLEPDSEKKRFFSEETIDLSRLEQLDVDVDLNLGAVRYNNNPILNGNAHLTANKTGLFITSENLSLMGGHSYFSFNLKRTKKEPALRLKLSSDNIQLDRIRLKNENDTLMSKGTADLVLSLKSSGTSAAAIAASTSGYISAYISDAEIKQKYASALDAGIVNWGKKKISKLSNGPPKKKKTHAEKTKHSLPVSCASFKGFINNGTMKISNGAIIVLPQNTLFSSGYINLKTEELAFIFRAKNKNFFNWSAISMIKYMEIAGVLSEPEVSLNTKELAKQGVLSVSSIVLGPIPALVYSLAETGVKNMNDVQCISAID